jgi:hypothetical protein
MNKRGLAMKQFEIKKFILKTPTKTYHPISFDIEEGQIWGIYSKDSTNIVRFLDQLSGLNNNHRTIFYRGKNVYDYGPFFKDRIYADFSTNYLTTLNFNRIQEVLAEDYRKEVDKDILKEHIRHLYVRGEYETNHSCVFTPTGNTYANFALTMSLTTKILMIANPTIHVRNHKELDYMVAHLTNRKKYENCILGLDHLAEFMNQLDHLLVFGDGDIATILNPKKDDLYIFESNISPEITLYKLFDSQDQQRMIVHRQYTEDELKMFKRRKISFAKISAYEFENYL